MDGPPAQLRRSGPERLAAWLLTGPLGHLLAFVADLAAAWVRWAARSLRGRLTRRR